MTEIQPLLTSWQTGTMSAAQSEALVAPLLRVAESHIDARRFERADDALDALMRLAPLSTRAMTLRARRFRAEGNVEAAKGVETVMEWL